MIRRLLKRVKLWFTIQALPVLDPKLEERIKRLAEGHIRDASEMMRRRRERHD